MRSIEERDISQKQNDSSDELSQFLYKYVEFDC